MTLRYAWTLLSALALAAPAAAQGMTSRPAGPAPFGAVGPVAPRPFDLPLDAALPALAGLYLLDDQDDRTGNREVQRREREAELYSQAYDAMTESRWDRAAAGFTRVAALNGARADAALYWKAYSQHRLGQRAEALTTIAELAKSHPNSSYLKQARVLEQEVRRAVGQPVRPQDQDDEDLKLMARHRRGSRNERGSGLRRATPRARGRCSAISPKAGRPPSYRARRFSTSASTAAAKAVRCSARSTPVRPMSI